MFVVESALDPPGPIPNPVVTQRSAGEYLVGDCLGGEAAASIPPSRPDRGGAEDEDDDTRRDRGHRWVSGAGWSSGSSLGS